MAGMQRSAVRSAPAPRIVEACGDEPVFGGSVHDRVEQR
jgi:Ni,Fe-hydrogenase III small subunit